MIEWKQNNTYGFLLWKEFESGDFNLRVEIRKTHFNDENQLYEWNLYRRKPPALSRKIGYGEVKSLRIVKATASRVFNTEVDKYLEKRCCSW